MAKAENIVTSICVEIQAPASLVWQVLTDWEHYKQWNSFCVDIKCSEQINELVRMQVRIPGTDEVIAVNEYLVAFEPERLLSWEQRAVPENLDAARRDQYIEAIDDKSCRYFTTDIFLGVNADTIMREHGAWVKNGFDQIARDLQQRAESLYAQRA